MFSVLEPLSPLPQQESVQYPYRRIALLAIFFLLSLGLYSWLSLVAPQLDQPIGPFMTLWGGCFLVYLIACLWLMTTRPSGGRWYWAELGIIFLGAVVFRVMLIHLPLGLSRDAWRYVWDGKMIANGYSPYQYAPDSPVLQHLRGYVYSNTPYFQYPTKYPPGAELFYVLGYLLSPSSLIGMKSLFVLCDLVTCLALACLLRMRGRDPRYAIFYAWSPLPIVEFAVQSHIDALTVACTVLAVLFAVSSWRYSGVLTGIFIGLATLTKLYPLILLVLVLRPGDNALSLLRRGHNVLRPGSPPHIVEGTGEVANTGAVAESRAVEGIPGRNTLWPLLVACFVTIVLGYLPFFVLSHGHILDASPLSSIIGQNEEHPGVIQVVLFDVGAHFHINATFVHLVTLGIEGCIVGGTLLFVIVQRIRGHLSIEMGLLLLTWVILVDYAHVFPWYATALLPWIAMCIVPVWSAKGFSTRGLAMLCLWYFTFTCVLSYFPVKQYATETNWLYYFGATFGVILIGLLVAASLYAWRTNREHTSFV